MEEHIDDGSEDFDMASTKICEVCEAVKEVLEEAVLFRRQPQSSWTDEATKTQTRAQALRKVIVAGNWSPLRAVEELVPCERYKDYLVILYLWTFRTDDSPEMKELVLRMMEGNWQLAQEALRCCQPQVQMSSDSERSRFLAAALIAYRLGNTGDSIYFLGLCNIRDPPQDLFEYNRRSIDFA